MLDTFRGGGFTGAVGPFVGPTNPDPVGGRKPEEPEPIGAVTLEGTVPFRYGAVSEMKTTLVTGTIGTVTDEVVLWMVIILELAGRLVCVGGIMLGEVLTLLMM